MFKIFSKKKSSGMTIPKAWGLFLGYLFLMILVVGVLRFSNKLNNNVFEMTEGIVLTFCILFVIFIAWLINDKVLPFNIKVSKKEVALTFLLGLSSLMFFSIFDIIDFASLFIDSKESSIKYIGISFLLSHLSDLLILVLIVLFIGHGLFKNYTFSVVCLNLAFFSFILFHLNGILELAITIEVCLLVYYKTRSAALTFILIFIIKVKELIFGYFYGINNTRDKTLKDTLFSDSTMYYATLVVSFLLFAYCLYYFIKMESPDWRKKEISFLTEIENF